MFPAMWEILLPPKISRNLAPVFAVPFQDGALPTVAFYPCLGSLDHLKTFFGFWHRVDRSFKKILLQILISFVTVLYYDTEYYFAMPTVLRI